MASKQTSTPINIATSASGAISSGITSRDEREKVSSRDDEKALLPDQAFFNKFDTNKDVSNAS